MERLDVLIFEKQLTDSREKARNRILAGDVLVNGKQITKPGTRVEADVEITLQGEALPFVGRGGLKLQKMMELCEISLEGLTCMDVGASTGGFTDCMLQHGAKKVYAVDVGTNQLVQKLREDPRVICMEQTNIRHLTKEVLSEQMDFVSADVSFISLTKILEPVAGLMKPGAGMVCLIKPQFEAGPAGIGKHGVVTSKKVHVSVLRQVLTAAVGSGYQVEKVTYSPICGQSGNIEYLFYAKLPGSMQPNVMEDWSSVERIVNEAFLYHSKSGKR